jgi:hypothetical protein
MVTIYDVPSAPCYLTVGNKVVKGIIFVEKKNALDHLERTGKCNIPATAPDCTSDHGAQDSD